jgi:2-polyprenyl-3-methyl-5-hydroxy-6-metoxy-1,4-benzoquinol methylase
MLYQTKRDLVKDLIHKTDKVLDVGFWGQGVDPSNSNWLHNVIRENAGEVYGLDVNISDEFLKEKNTSKEYYKRGFAENTDFDTKFDVIFAGDLIEHLTNPGMFLDSCRKMLNQNGRLILTTPNAFNLFNLFEKLSKNEPTVNADHTFYFNSKVLKILLDKCDYEVEYTSFVYKLDTTHRESFKKKIQNVIYAILSRFTTKFVETLVVVAKPNN